jgi:hypothetical protein
MFPEPYKWTIGPGMENNPTNDSLCVCFKCGSTAECGFRQTDGEMERFRPVCQKHLHLLEQSRVPTIREYTR